MLCLKGWNKSRPLPFNIINKLRTEPWTLKSLGSVLRMVKTGFSMWLKYNYFNFFVTVFVFFALSDAEMVMVVFFF